MHGQSRRIVRPDLKKRRPPVACIQCYSRKIKCGRESPACGRCIRTGKGHECTYRSESSHTHPREDTRNRLTKAAEHLSQPSTTTTSAERERGGSRLGQIRCPTPSMTEGRMTHLKGTETSTRFYGFSYHLNFYQQFPELRSYIARLKIQHPAINQLRDEIYRSTTKMGPRQPLRQGGTAENFELLVPARSTTDSLVQTYIDRFEVINRVIHVPTFMSDYRCHWESPRGMTAVGLAQLLLIIATASSLHPEISIDGTDLKPSHDLALQWIEAVESWLISSSLDPAPESLSALMTHCLLVIAKRATYIQESALWSSTGQLVRWAMAAGYHREVGSRADISPFHREMRRRLWTTIVELDLQASIERGMPPSIKPGDFNTNLPLHVDDDALQESTQDMLTSQPLNSWTTTSFQVILHRSFMTRLDICSLVNGAQDQDMFDQVLQLGDKLVQALQEIPTWRNTGRSPRENQTINYVQSMLVVVLNQYLLVLHIPLSIQTPPTLKAGISRRVRLDASAGMLIHYRRLVEDGILSDCACRNGLVLGALNLCHEIYLCRTASENQGITTLAMPEIAQVYLSMADHVLHILHRRVATTLEGLNEFYVLAMVIGLVKSKIWPQLAAVTDEEAAEQVIQLSKIMRSAVTRPRVDGTELDSTQAHAEQSNAWGLSPSPSDRVDYFLPMLLPEDLGFLQSDLDVEQFQI